MLLGQLLQRAGIEFVDARAQHTSRGMKNVEIVVADEEAKKKCDEWVERVVAAEGPILDAKVRIATAEELERFKKLQDMEPW